MSAYDTHVIKELKKRLLEQVQSKNQLLVDGRAQDYAHYRELVGYLRASGDALAILADVLQMKEEQ